ncbi:unnamed protein product [Staurois parvus]|uniref:Secreted protein n=1 Tax=Staurois parvus TaxID=386267 RepID=A0ABN9G1X9_9NEOB|nr:unnamed protein product [Staurois parvus]
MSYKTFRGVKNCCYIVLSVLCGLPTGLLLGPGVRLRPVLPHLVRGALHTHVEHERVLYEVILELLRPLSVRPVLRSLRLVLQPHPGPE